MTLYDVLGARHDGGWHRHLSVDEVLAHAPGMRRERLRGGLLFHDGMEDDARYTLAVARTAREDGATVVTRARADALIEEGGRVVGVAGPRRPRRRGSRGPGPRRHRRDRRLGCRSGVAPFRRDARLLPVAGRPSRRPARADPERCRADDPRPRQGRVPRSVAAFLADRHDRRAVRRADRPADGRPRRGRRAPRRGQRRPRRRPRRGTTSSGTYAGLRPLIAPSGDDASTIRASREHRVVVEANGLVRVSGGKYTTYRAMAEQTVDAALGVLGERPAARPSRTPTRRLVGRGRPPGSRRSRGRSDRGARAGRPAVVTASSRATAREATEVLALGRECGLLGRLVDGEDHLEIEVRVGRPP